MPPASTVILGLLAGSAHPAAAADAVTKWSLLADSIAHGSANWHSLAIMHQAMHDARNAAEPVYARWFPPTSDEPARAGADPNAAMAAAARRVLATEHSTDSAAIGQTYQTAVARTPAGPARQSSQRGYLHLAVALLDMHPRPGGAAAHARIMSQLASALADSAVLIWKEKERFGFWRPVTAIREGTPGMVQDRDWLPFIATPAHPEYPSGHASDCFTGSDVLQGAFPDLQGPVACVAQVGRPLEGADANSMGQHAQDADSGLPARREFPGLADMARECSNSRIWAGAHFRTAAEESERVAVRISAWVLAAMPAR